MVGGWHETLRTQELIEERERRYRSPVTRAINRWLELRVNKRLKRAKGINVDFKDFSKAELGAAGQTPDWADVRKISRTLYVYKWQKRGLRNEDFSNWLYPGMEEVYASRLPGDLKAYHELRKRRALLLELKTAYLPQDQWTASHEDMPHMLPYIQEALEEQLEKEAWKM